MQRFVVVPRLWVIAERVLLSVCGCGGCCSPAVQLSFVCGLCVAEGVLL